MHIQSIVVVVFAVLLQACGVPQSPAAFDQTPEAQYLKATVDQLVAREYAGIEARMDDRVQQPDVRAALERLASMLPPGAPNKLEPVEWRFVETKSATTGVASRTAHVAIEYAFPESRWIVASATLSGDPGALRLLAFNLEPRSAPLAELNAFTFAGKGVSHGVHLVLALCAFGISAYAFVRCIRTRGLKRKWLWAIFTLAGLGSFSLNWTDGAVSFHVLHFNLISAGFARAGWVGPWTITFGVPVGALAFLWKVRGRGAVSPGAP